MYSRATDADENANVPARPSRLFVLFAIGTAFVAFELEQALERLSICIGIVFAYGPARHLSRWSGGSRCAIRSDNHRRGSVRLLKGYRDDAFDERSRCPRLELKSAPIVLARSTQRGSSAGRVAELAGRSCGVRAFTGCSGGLSIISPGHSPALSLEEPQGPAAPASPA